MNNTLEGPSIRYARAAEPAARVERARELAREVEDLLQAASEQVEDAYQIRLAQAMACSLIDQLEELLRGPTSATRVTSARHS